MFHLVFMFVFLNMLFSIQGMSYYWMDGVQSFKENNAYRDSKLIHLIDQARWHYQSRPQLQEKIAEEIKKNTSSEINWQNNKGFTALHLAVAIQDVDTIRLLLTRTDIQINLKTNEGKTPLFLAIPLPETDSKNVSTIVQLLIDHGADPMIEDQYGNNAYDQAKNNTHLIKIMKIGRALYEEKAKRDQALKESLAKAQEEIKASSALSDGAKA